MRFKSVSEMPEGLRKLFEAQYEITEEGKYVERAIRKVLTTRPDKTQPTKILRTEIPDTVSPEITWTPYRAMNVGADQIALDGLNKTETRYLEILRSRPENIWIGVHVFRLRIAANTHYTPDFATLDTDGVFTFYDSKGKFTYEDAQLKMKMVARMFPMFKWVKAELTLATHGKNPRPESLKETLLPG